MTSNQPQYPYVVAVTGGIGSGKTYICDMFSAMFDIKVIDADLIAREIVEPGKPCLKEIISEFGTGVLNDNNTLNRAALKSVVFSDESKRKALEKITHPKIREEISNQIKSSTMSYCLISIPLVAESERRQKFDRILVVDCSEKEQLERVMSRDLLEKEEVSAIMKAQATREERLSIADDVIDNSSQQISLTTEIQRLHKLYEQLAQKLSPVNE
ncbi:dephospho-CoA kinase [Gammaproteobacteria bacterium]|nr:dephospho-CoA kinase [Gammaproteobacteria bacterium]